jgi:hypothetical protein
MPEVTRHLSAAEIAHCLTAERYLGSTAQFLRAAQAEHGESRKR